MSSINTINLIVSSIIKSTMFTFDISIKLSELKNQIKDFVGFEPKEQRICVFRNGFPFKQLDSTMNDLSLMDIGLIDQDKVTVVWQSPPRYCSECNSKRKQYDNRLFDLVNEFTNNIIFFNIKPSDKYADWYIIFRRGVYCGKFIDNDHDLNNVLESMYYNWFTLEELAGMKIHYQSWFDNGEYKSHYDVINEITVYCESLLID